MMLRNAFCRRLPRPLISCVCIADQSSIRVSLLTTVSKTRSIADHTPVKAQTCAYSSSALFVNRGDTSSVVTVDLDLNLEDCFADVEKLEANIRKRKMESKIDLQKILRQYKHLQDIENQKRELEVERETINERMKLLVKKKTDDDADKKTYLISRGKEIKEELKKLQKTWWSLEEEVTLDSLKLPVALHANTNPDDVIVNEHGQKPAFDFAVKSHAELGYHHKLLHFSEVSPGAYYLYGDLALSELQLTGRMSEMLHSCGFTQFSCPDVVKTLVIEACGEDFNNKDQVFTLQAKAVDVEAHLKRSEGDGGVGSLDKWDITLHLCGGASAYSFVAYLTRMNLCTEDLPLRWFSSGRHYTPNDVRGNVDLLNTTQSTRVEMFGAAKDLFETDVLYQEYCDIMWNTYTQFELPIRLVQVGSADLRHMEASRTEVQAWLPSQEQYIPISSMSLWNDFVSRRLMIKHHENVDDVFSTNYIHMVHGSLLNVPYLLAAIMENQQTWDDGCEFKIPVKLQTLSSQS